MPKLIDLALVDQNTGQIPGLPANPRIIRDARFQQLKQSIASFPEMLELREVILFPHAGRFVAIAGNQRVEACRDLGQKKIPHKLLKADFPIDRLRELAIKDNEQFGEYDFDLLAADWATDQLIEWGVELPDIESFQPNLDPEYSHRQVSAEDIVKSKEQLEQHFKDPDQYKAVMCPHCAEEFFIKDE